MDPPKRISAGRIGRPHGLDGSFYVTRPRPRLLELGAELGVAGRTLTIVRRAGTDSKPIVRLAGIDGRAALEPLRGEELTVEQEQAPALQDGEWWAHELEGCLVFAGSEPLGTVTRMVELPSCEAIEVTPAEGTAPLLVPLVKDAVRSVEVATRRIEVDPEFLDLPADGGSERP